jgi:hypothetical protein
MTKFSSKTKMDEKAGSGDVKYPMCTIGTTQQGPYV